MDTRVSPLARREEQRYRVKRVGRRTLGRGVTRGEQGIIKGERFTTLVWNSYALRTYHCLRSESFKEPLLTRSSLSLSLSLSSIFSLSVLRATLWQPERTRGRWCEQEISCTVRNRTSRSPTRRPFKKTTTTGRERENRRGCGDTDRITEHGAS